MDILAVRMERQLHEDARSRDDYEAWMTTSATCYQQSEGGQTPVLRRIRAYVEAAYKNEATVYNFNSTTRSAWIGGARHERQVGKLRHEVQKPPMPDGLAVDQGPLHGMNLAQTYHVKVSHLTGSKGGPCAVLQSTRPTKMEELTVERLRDLLGELPHGFRNTVRHHPTFKVLTQLAKGFRWSRLGNVTT